MWQRFIGIVHFPRKYSPNWPLKVGKLTNNYSFRVLDEALSIAIAQFEARKLPDALALLQLQSRLNVEGANVVNFWRIAIGNLAFWAGFSAIVSLL